MIFTQTATGQTNYWDAYWGTDNFFVLGQKDGNGRNGAIRFTNVTISQGTTISSAQLSIAGEFVNGSTNLKIRTNGIDEDNTGAFTSNPMGRTETTAQTNSDDALPSAGNTFNVDVTSQVQEILNRAGWASGNAMGFHLNDNGTANGTNLEDDQGTGLNTVLTINYVVPSASPSASRSASASVSPSASISPSSSQSPSSSASPSPLPTFLSGVMKVAKLGVNVLNNSDVDKFIFTSEYGTLKYYLNGNTSIHIVGDDTDQITTTTIAHNLGYAPLFIVYVNTFASGGATDRYSVVPHESDVGVRIRRAEAWVDDTNLYIQLRNKSLQDDTAVFYYKIFKNNLGM